MLDTVMNRRQDTQERRRWHGGSGACGARVLAAGLILLLTGCADVLSGLTASLGGGTAGERGTVRVVFINNTPYEAVFTTGTYDPLDELSPVPGFSQFGYVGSPLILSGDSESAVGGFECARVFSIGSDPLLTRIEQNEEDTANLVVEAMDRGVTFVTEQGAGSDPIVEGAIASFEARLGTDFPCGALLIIRFEINDVGDEPFRIDFEMVPSESPR